VFAPSAPSFDALDQGHPPPPRARCRSAACQLGGGANWLAGALSPGGGGSMPWDGLESILHGLPSPYWGQEA